MGLFRRISRNSNNRQPNVKITKDDRDHFKVRTVSVNDPILEAVHEAQPFEQAADTFQENINRVSHISGEGNLKDIFGQVIQHPDVSNPTRSRDERPLDTIRGFEYAINGDPGWIQQLETNQYGFRVRPDFLYFNGNNPYSSHTQRDQHFSIPEQSVYQPVQPPKLEKTRKKKGLFGRKKN